MNPKNIFRTQSNSKISIYFLSIITSFQLVILSFDHLTFRIPLKSIKLIEDAVPILQNCTYRNLSFQRKSFFLEEIKFKDRKYRYEIKCTNVLVKFSNYLDLISLKPSNFLVGKLTISFTENKNPININALDINFLKDKLQILFDLNSKYINVESKGLITRTFGKNQKSNNFFNISQLDRFINLFDNLPDKYLDRFYDSKNKLSYILNFTVNDSYLLYINQKGNADNNLLHSDYCSYIEINKSNNKLQKLGVRIKDLILKFKNQSLTFGIHEIKNLTQNSDNLDFQINTKDILGAGKINGSFPNIESFTKKSSSVINFSLFSDSNSCKISNSIDWNTDTNDFRIKGLNYFFPDNLDLFILRDKKRIDLFTGDAFKVNIASLINGSSVIHNSLNIKANNFSVLNSPKGNYFANGQLDSNFSVYLNKVTGIMGSSNVNGSYSQKWSPNSYQFIVDGNCIPTDISNWFGSWWRDIWKDFSFSESEIPYGNFIISGIWGESNNSITYGHVNCKNIVYKQLPLERSILNVVVEGKNTTIQSKSTKHAFGELKGTLSFQNNNEQLNYSIEGDYPLNIGKKPFGEKVENYLKDFNITKIDILSEGEIPISKIDLTLQKLKPSFFIRFNADQKGSWFGLNFESMTGSIEANSSDFLIKLNNLKTNTGELSLELKNNSTKDWITLNTDIKNCLIFELSKSLTSLQKKSNPDQIFDKQYSYESKESLIDLTLQASGPSSNFMKLNGSGKIKVIDKELSRIPLFGFLSEGLLKSPIPIPTGSLSFDTLEGLFELKNEKIVFENLILSGNLSKAECKGSVDVLNKTIDFNAKLKLLGNIPIPLIDKIASLADPVSFLAEFKISGDWNQPSWKLLIDPLKSFRNE